MGDATVYNEELSGKADVVIADVPCSGLGVMGRKNDIKFSVTAESINELVKLQRAILCNAVRYVKCGGTLLFSTCTVSKQENLDNFEYIVNELKLKPVDFYDLVPDGLKDETAKKGYLQLYGESGLSDGFFIGRFTK